MPSLKRKLLEEMVYERLLAAVDPMPIIDLGVELDRSLARLAEEGAIEDACPEEVKRVLLRKALARLDETICDFATEQLPLA